MKTNNYMIITLLTTIVFSFFLGCTSIHNIPVEDQDSDYAKLFYSYNNLPSWFKITNSASKEYYSGLWKKGLTPGFTRENIRSLSVGLHADIIELKFGMPDKIQVDTCGSSTAKSWQCTRWIYRGNYCFNSNCVTFFNEDNELYVNNWHIESMENNVYR